LEGLLSFPEDGRFERSLLALLQLLSDGLNSCDNVATEIYLIITFDDFFES
jgi:hypothetical protein